MATFTDVFERKEVKFRLSAPQRTMMLREIEKHMEPDAYGNTRIHSLYFDTPERELIERSLDKPLYKEKLRLRSYGEADEWDRVYIEIKKKFDGIVYKRRVGCSADAAHAYLSGTPYPRACERFPLADEEMRCESLSERSLQITREINQLIARYRPLHPSMLISCERQAYIPREARAAHHHAATGADLYDLTSDLRITFDTDIAYDDLFQADADRLSAEESGKTTGTPLIEDGESIMEIKVMGAFPLWLVDALDRAKAYPTSFSKYGEAYRACNRVNRVTPSTVAARLERPAFSADTPADRPVGQPHPTTLKEERCA